MVSHMGNPVGGMTKILYCCMSNFIKVTVSHNTVVVDGNSTRWITFLDSSHKKRTFFIFNTILHLIKYKNHM